MWRRGVKHIEISKGKPRGNLDEDAACERGYFLESLEQILSLGNCEEELPKKPVSRLSVNCRPSVDRQVTDSLLTAYQQVTDRLRKKKNCGKHEQLM